MRFSCFASCIVHIVITAYPGKLARIPARKGAQAHRDDRSIRECVPGSSVVVICTGPSAESLLGCDRVAIFDHGTPLLQKKRILHRIIPTSPLVLLVVSSSDRIELNNAKPWDGGACKGKEPRS